MPDAVTQFEHHRTTVRGLAYRMLGSRGEADDVVQDTWLRWCEVDHAAIDDAGRYLTRIASNLCLDRLNSARARREVYVGSWLPEPVVDAASLYEAPPESASELADDLSFALMLALERLSPAERAAFILHDVFGYGFDQLADILERSSAACRQLASRARVHVRSAEPRFDCPPDRAEAIANAFAGFVMAEGDGRVIQTIALEPDVAGRINTIYIVRNPDKLAAVTRI